MPKITIIGAGSTGFTKAFLADILTRPELAEKTTVALMDISQENLAVAAALARKMVRQSGRSTVIKATTDRRCALDGANYVANVMFLHGNEIFNRALEIARTYGVDQVVGCTTGPNGVFIALRYVPVLTEICKEMEELCPDAILFNYCNPAAINPWALSKISPIQVVGMCHSVQGTAQTLARYIGVPYEETGHWVAGLNHQAWFLRFEWNGTDAYPLLWEKMEDPEIYEQDVVRCEMLRYFGYFVTESSYHNGEYVPYFRRTRQLIGRYTPTRGSWAGLGYEYTNKERHARKETAGRMALHEEAFGDAPLEICPSDEYTIGVIHAIETNTPYRFNATVQNTGLITNLPDGFWVEAPCLVDSMGIHPCFVGDLPPQCAALNRNRMNQDELAVKAALEGDRKAAEQAIALDPLTAAVLTLDEIHDMVERIFSDLAEYLPQFK